MKPYDQQLSELLRRTETATDFGPLMDYFLTQLGQSEQFLADCHAVEHKMLAHTVEAVVGQVLKKKRVTLHMRILRCAQTGFYHGACHGEGAIVAVFYFQNQNVGVLSIMSPPPSSLGAMVRFRCLPVASPASSAKPN